MARTKRTRKSVYSEVMAALEQPPPRVEKLPIYEVQLRELKREPRNREAGQRSKFGGKPTWIQGNETPRCPECRKRMAFVAQIDSIHHNEPTNPHRRNGVIEPQPFMFGDVGMIYVFYCFECGTSANVVQWY